MAATAALSRLPLVRPRRAAPSVAFAATLAALVATLAAGCASSGGHASAPTLGDELRSRGLDPSTIAIPFQIDPAARRWLQNDVHLMGEPEQRLEELLAALLARSEPSLSYRSGFTGTATEVFTTGRANCLGFTHLFVGLARELGFPVYYLRVGDLQSFSREGDLVVVSEHVTAAYGSGEHRRILEFTGRPIVDYRMVQPISDRTAIALHYANRGAELLQDGDLSSAIQALETAVKVDDELAEAWLNLGVGRRRSGRFVEAEAAYRRALELDPTQSSAFMNLSVLLRLLGRERESIDLLSVSATIHDRNPFAYVAMGDIALQFGRLDEAERFYRRALRQDPNQAETMAAFASLALARGDTRSAQKWLRKAKRADPENARVAGAERQILAAAHRRVAS